MNRFKRHRDSLLILSKARPSVVKSIITPGSRDLIDTLSEGSLNILRGNLALSSSSRKKLKAYKTQLRQLAKKRASIKKRKSILQKGGFVKTLASILLPLAIKGIAQAIKQKRRRKR